MKSIALFAVLLAFAAQAQHPANVKPAGVKTATETNAPLTGTEFRSSGRPTLPTLTPHHAASGVLVQAARTRNPIKLFDPRPEPGHDPYENVSRDPMTGRAQGIKLFSFSF
jgi:hypothetical protein